VAHQRGRHELAIQLIERAVALNPGRAAYHANLAEAYRATGELDRAASCGRIALRLRPAYPEAANNLGMALLQQGQVQAAIEQFRAAWRFKPNFALACNNLGNALRLQGDQAGALAHFRQAVAIDPHLAEGHCNLTQMLLENKQLHEALGHGREAVRLRPTLSEAHSNLGNVLRELGRLDEAKACYTEALRLNPGLGMLYNNMGQALQEQGQLDDALVWYQRGLEVEPTLARLHGNLGSALAEQERYAEAITCYETALRFDPNDAEAHNGLGWIWHEQARYEDAQERYHSAMRLKPDFAPAHCNLGAVREELSDFAEAERCFREALLHDPGQAGAWNQLAALLRGKLPDTDLAAMRRLLADPGLTDARRAALHFGLAQVLDSRKDYAEAGEHLCRANSLALVEWRKRGQGYDPALHNKFVDQLVATFSSTFFARVRAWGVETERPIFIVGLPRSGTTLVEQILARHSQVFGAGELPLAREDFAMLSAGEAETADGLEARAFEHLSRLDAVTVSRLAQRHLEQLRALNEPALRVADKMPDNYLCLGLLATLFPRAKFIHCRRDLRDVAVSCWMTNFRALRWTNDPEHIASRFREYHRMMAHWGQVLPVPVLEVDYEETVADLEGVARRLVAWCGLQWESGCLAFYEGKGPVRTASVVQVRQPIYTRSVGRWKNYEPSLGALFANLYPEPGGPFAQASSEIECITPAGQILT
jgi:tetratricopeptide (TPR) repeat protein